MKLKMRLQQRFVHLQTLEQKLALKQLLSLHLTLQHPENTCLTAKGLEGMQTAHQVLKEHKLHGILIGGLSEEIWNQQTKPEDLYTHKDVDVAILDPVAEDSPLNEFEGGIDWWLPQSERIVIRNGSGDMELQKTWYRNGFGVILAFGMQKKYSLTPGLYLPSQDWVISMRLYESLAQIDFTRVHVEMDENVFQKFREKMREKVKTRLPQFLKREF